MTNNTNKKKSAARKLLPAVSMLTVSAVMLSTATYAWFTMNKTVEVTGLTMQATVSQGLEISGGEATTGNTATNNTPAADSITWKRKIAISDYYDTGKKLVPASSATSLNLYKVDTKDVYAGGREVNANTDNVTAVATSDTATMTLGTYMNGSYSVNSSDEEYGYYVDIPYWIRTSNNSSTDGTKIYCTVTISNPDSDVEGSSDGSELQKAVRVAIIPLASSANNISPDYTANASINSVLTDNSATIFGTDSATYRKKNNSDDNGALNEAGTFGTALLAPQTVNKTKTKVFTIPQANNNCFGQVMFVVRVWLEGESTSCWDANANQDWNIDLSFTTDAT